MTVQAPVEELKVRARVRLNRARREDPGTAQTLGAHLQTVAREVGFLHWEHARRVLGGAAAPDTDMGDFWHVPRTGLLLHSWFARHGEAAAALTGQPDGFLLPYRRQCFIVSAPFIEALGLAAADPAWQALGRDMVAGYGTPAWRHLAWQRIRAPLPTFQPRPSSFHAHTTYREL
ncbi:hypothetical protein [Acidovorax sp. Leaf160]|uniref:hypothetical protein n=1 Tax=Acidovorax sp. Leaf160 TaxID=1736280 RepID=UPI000AD1C986|nr:hypothetical protein [Acidovorax sp. Leaf160]